MKQPKDWTEERHRFPYGPHGVKPDPGSGVPKLCGTADAVSGARAISVLLIGEHRLLRAGLMRLLEGVGHISIAGDTAPDGTMVKMVRERLPDVIIFSVHGEHQTTGDRIRDLLRSSPASKIIVLLASPSDPSFTRRLFESISGILAYDSTVQDMLSAICRVKAGGNHVAPEVAHHLIASMRAPSSPLDKLSTREMQVMRMTVDGLRPLEIAARMAVSRRTVGTFRHRIFKKLKVKSDVELMRLTWDEQRACAPRIADL